MIDVFISYAREDQGPARDLFEFLKRSGFRPWMDKENLIPGMTWENEIERAVGKSHLQIFLLSPRSVGKRGVFQKEIRLALSKAEQMLESDISIIPIRIDDCEVPDALQKYQWVDYSDPRRNELIISALNFAAKQRGLLSDSGDPRPIVSEILNFEEASADGLIVSSFSVPKIIFPRNEALGSLVSALVFGSASDLILSFRNEVDEVFWKEHGSVAQIG